MEAKSVQPRQASTEVIFRFLGDVPWWIVIVAIVGLLVGFSVLTNVRYLDAISFLFDFPWDKDLIGEVPVEGDHWLFSPEPAIPLSPGTYRLYAAFYEAEGVVAPEGDQLTVYREPDPTAEQSAVLDQGDRVSIVKWKVKPKEQLRPEEWWALVETEDGRTGWALDEEFNNLSFDLLAESEVYAIEIPEGAEPVAINPIETPSEQFLPVDSSTPTIGGAVAAGSFIRIYDDFEFGQTLARIWNAKGLVLTLRATMVGFGLALLLGLLTGLMLVSKNPITLAISKLYVEVIRGIPMLVIILYAGFVISPALRDASGGKIDLRGFPGAVIGLGFGYGAYLAEVFRAGIQSIHYGQMEAARSLGMSYFQSMRYIVLPQAIRVILPPLGNDFIAMLKDSSLISVVALPEILQQGRLWVSRTFRGFEGYNTVALFYLVMTLILSLLVRFIESKAALPGRSED